MKKNHKFERELEVYRRVWREEKERGNDVNIL